MVHMDPCCGGSLQTGTKIVAIVQLVLSVCTTVSGIIMLSLSAVAGTITANSSKNDFHGVGGLDNHTTGSNGKEVAAGFTVNTVIAILGSVVIMMVGVFGLIMSIILLKGSNQRNVRKCRVWLVIKSILLVVAMASFIVNVSSDPKGEQAFCVIELMLNLYCMCVVYAFIKELREEEAASMPRSFYGNKA